MKVTGVLVTRRGWLAGVAGAGVLGSVARAQEELQKVSVRGVTFEVPKAWKGSKPASAMRLAQYAVGPVGDDKEAAELVLFAFPGGAGTVEANLERWQNQFVDEGGNPPVIESVKRPGKNVEVIVAECSGRYVAAVSPGSPEKYDKPGWRLLGAIVTTPNTGYFFKMVGPDKTMTAAKPAFEAMIKSMEVREE